MYYVYILQCEDGSLYTGITTDVGRRFREHQGGSGGHYTRSHRPRKIVYKKGIGTRGAALRREAEIKAWPREKKMRLARIAR